MPELQEILKFFFPVRFLKLNISEVKWHLLEFFLHLYNFDNDDHNLPRLPLDVPQRLRRHLYHEFITDHKNITTLEIDFCLELYLTEHKVSKHQYSLHVLSGQLDRVFGDYTWSKK